MAIPGIENIDFGGVVSQLIYWTGVSVASAGILAVFIGIYYMTSFPFKVTVLPLVGSGEKGKFSIGKIKSNRIRYSNKQRTAWRTLWPLMNNKDVEPFPAHNIYAGKQIFAYELDGELIPARIDVLGQADSVKISPVPHYIRNWQSLQHKKIDKELSEHGFWEENKYFIMVIVTALICLILVGMTVYFTYKYAAPGLAQTKDLTAVIKGLGQL